MIFGITLIVLSIIAVPSLLLSKKPNAKELLEKIEPYQGWIGLIFCFYGIWGIVFSILNLGWISTFPIWWGTLLAGNIIQAVLGFMLGFSLINKYVLSKNDTVKDNAIILREKLAPKQGKLGLIGIVVGIWMIVANILFF
ncbi:conserved hypothetical membrane protein [Formosa agariphila KMM 3901]|uniref:Conserved hypothetical membrane protein n=1 Tax=Formosa agariphila (strain DSM 15362 / KCTC 12365 / LMG 23005 / KMM 3901 / M-2Alg 35-1) TaxID=1347342 RepID=T2KKR9_FORAG|nr:hypothetical protein [Formosa agariphila]CDF79330.1 conserved hypothetical membrane protein [Formosa agariphila KMM 3901]